tara:strand:+ start:420 stop:1541 length:1122 start_codon:yes stop_codon:yes gene_type:complete
MKNKNFYNLSKLNKFVKNPKFKNCLIISGKKSFKLSGALKIFAQSNKITNLKNSIYFKKYFIPKLEEVTEIIKLIKKKKPSHIFAVGGGASLDLAKSANLLSSSKNILRDIKKPRKDLKNYCNLIAIPTTAGSGAEVTSNSVVYIKNKKFSLEHKEIKPSTNLLVPDFVVKNKKSIKASAGFDAIAQAIESIISMRSNSKSLTFATESLKISFKNYINYIKNPNYNNSAKMLLASNLAGKAIDITKTTAPHAISYPFTFYYGVSHGHAVSLTLSEILSFNYQYKENSKKNFPLNDRFKLLFRISNTYNIDNFVKLINYLKKKAGLSDKFKSLNIDIKRDINKILLDVNPKRLANNPVELHKQDIKDLLLKKNS